MPTNPVSDAELRKRLTPEQYYVLRQKGTEHPGSGELLYNNEKGMYVCPVCGNALFSSDTKYNSHTPGLIGWPSFTEATSKSSVELRPDNELWMKRTEVICAKCGSHLGHLFEDPSSPNGQHFCINSAALAFQKAT